MYIFLCNLNSTALHTPNILNYKKINIFPVLLLLVMFQCLWFRIHAVFLAQLFGIFAIPKDEV